jgi:heme-degrading monooxygenase HmoA
MIARIWHGQTTSAKADAYVTEYFPQTGLADYQATEGNLGVVVLRKDRNGEADFLMLTLWESEDAIRKFAGDDMDQARYYPQDRNYFDVMEPNVAHYEVLIQRIKGPAE